MKTNAFIVSATSIVWLLVSMMKKLSLLEITNLTFIAGIITLVIYAIIVIIESKFLSLFTNGFKKINYLLFPQSRASKRAEELVDNDHELIEWKQSIREVLKKIVISISITTLSISMVCLVLLYWIL